MGSDSDHFIEFIFFFFNQGLQEDQDWQQTHIAAWPLSGIYLENSVLYLDNGHICFENTNQKPQKKGQWTYSYISMHPLKLINSIEALQWQGVQPHFSHGFAVNGEKQEILGMAAQYHC